MGKIVAAVAQSHILCSNEGVEQQAANVFNGFKSIGRQIAEAAPDVIIVISDDHMFNVTSALQVPLSVSTGNRLTPFGDMELPIESFQGYSAFADGFVHFAAEHAFDLARLEEEGFKPDHGVVVPLMFANPTRKIPTVVINVNINMQPIPSPKRCWNLGLILGAYIREARPAEEKAAIIATGGLSHWLNVEHDGELNPQWDEEIIRLFETGDYEQAAGWTTAEITGNGGNGGVEIVNWLMMAAAVNGARAERVFYEPIYAWRTAMAGIVMKLPA